MGLHSNVIFNLLWQKLFLALPQGIDQWDDILISDVRRGIICHFYKLANRSVIFGKG